MPAGSRVAAEFAEKLRAEIYSTILNADPGPKFREQLRAAMAKDSARTYAAASSSAPTRTSRPSGHTGAGLTLTVFTAVGFENIVKPISEVWP